MQAVYAEDMEPGKRGVCPHRAALRELRPRRRPIEGPVGAHASLLATASHELPSDRPIEPLDSVVKF